MSIHDKQFGMLTIISSPRPNVYKCRCKCGNVIELWRSQLANKVVRHCECRDTGNNELSFTGTTEFQRSYATDSPAPNFTATQT
jgi:hypothetical protein